ncbi:MAG: cytidylyltransferase domain-containing protein [Nocardioidaceae bacterium]
MTRVGIVTQARTGSTRLPGKVLIELAGRTVLGHHLERLARTGLPVYVATSTGCQDDPIVAVAQAHGVPAYRGSEQDVLARFHGCATAYDLDVVVRVTSDCPLIDPATVTEGVRRFREAGDPGLYLSNCVTRSYPRGFDFEVFSADALAAAFRGATLPSDREHVTPYLYREVATRVQNLGRHEDRSGYRVTLDTPDDLELVRALLVDHGAAALSGEEIVALLDAHPALVALNGHVEQKRL